MSTLAMLRSLVRRPVLPAALLHLTLLCGVPVLGQNEIYQRTFPVSVNQAKAAVQAASATSKGRLPTLEGFVEQNEQPIDRYEKGYFECFYQVSPAAGGGTAIRATAKITAWYSDPVAARSGYRVMISNGRLETDALDRIAESLTPNAAPSQATLPASPAAGDFRRSVQPVVPAPGTSNKSAVPFAATPHTNITPTFSLPAGANFDSIKAMRSADEKKSQELATLISNLEEIQRGQSHPGDLAAVRKSKTPIFAKPAESSAVLMTADAQDEFQILAVESSWVHVQISGMSRGWIRRAQLEMPSGFAQTAGTEPENPASGGAMFKVAKEETRSFSGSWPPLKGKFVQIEWVEPANPAVITSRQEKLAFAKSVFLHASANLPGSTQNTEGIVVVFDSADGGQIAAALSSVKALANRTLSDSAFWRECSLDPPESFLDSAKQ